MDIVVQAQALETLLEKHNSQWEFKISMERGFCHVMIWHKRFRDNVIIRFEPSDKVPTIFLEDIYYEMEEKSKTKKS